jgi:hypothetical protein
MLTIFSYTSQVFTYHLLRKVYLDLLPIFQLLIFVYLLLRFWSSLYILLMLCQMYSFQIFLPFTRLYLFVLLIAFFLMQMHLLQNNLISVCFYFLYFGDFVQKLLTYFNVVKHFHFFLLAVL